MADFSKYGTPTKKPVAPTATGTSPAKPVVSDTTGSKFSKYGTPTASVVPRETPEKKSGVGEFFKGLIRPVATTIARPIQAIAELGGASAESVDKKTKDLVGDIVAPVPQNGKDVVKDIGRAAETVALGMGGGAAKDAAGNIIKQTFKQAVKTGAKEGLKVGAVQGAGAAMEDTGEFSSAIPGAIKGGAIGAGFGVAAPLAVKGVGSAFRKGASEIANATEKESVDTLVGRITQAKNPKVIEQSKKALKHIDTSNVKTYEDFNKTVDDTISSFSKKQDQLLEALGSNHKLNDLTVPIKVGDKIIKPNYVKTAIAQLKQHYKASGDIEALTKVGQLEKKATKSGLSTQEVNLLAREHGTELASKAFGVTGEPLTGVNKVAFENARKGLKTTVRSHLPGEASKSLDEAITHMKTLQRTSRKMVEAVQQLENKVKDRGILERMGRFAGKGVDMATGGSLKGFLTSFIPSNVGNKVMNSIEIEKELVKNLTKVNKLVKSGSDRDLLQFIDSIIKKGVKLETKTGAVAPKPKSVFGRPKVAPTVTPKVVPKEIPKGKEGAPKNAGNTTSKVLLLGSAASSVPATLGYLQQKFGTVQYSRGENVSEANKSEAKSSIDTDNIVKGIAYNETRGVKEPYSYRKPSGSKTMGDDMGKYQITEGELKTYAKRFLGKTVSATDFMKSPEIQDKYIKSKIEWLHRQYGWGIDEILASHRGGMSKPDEINRIKKERSSYVQNAKDFISKNK